jgi:hemerythrin superfamily protein
VRTRAELGIAERSRAWHGPCDCHCALAGAKRQSRQPNKDAVMSAMSFFSPKSDTHAFKILKKDHETVDALFKEWKSADDNARKAALVNEICNALTVHAQIEEEILYPEALRALDNDGDALIREAAVEHGTLKGLITRLDGSGPSDEMFEAHVTVLMEYVKHHVKEEENEMFPKIEKTDLDLEDIGLRMQVRKDQLEGIVAAAPKPARGKVAVASITPPRRRAA